MSTKRAAAARAGISPATITTRRLKLGWPKERAMTAPNQSGFRQPDSHPWKAARFGRGRRLPRKTTHQEEDV